jgi:hypothetical protein
MLIEISQRLSPFSHKPGNFFLVPGSSLQVQVFPTKLFFTDLSVSENASFTVDVDLQGPHKDFTVEQNLEKGEISVFSHTKEGFVRYTIAAGEKGIELFCEKVFPRGLTFHIGNEKFILFSKDSRLLELPSFEKKQSYLAEKISLGVHKKQNWEQISQRKQLCEILPIWFSLSQTVPLQKGSDSYSGTGFFLRQCEDLVAKGEKLRICDGLLQFFDGAFEGVLAPRCNEVNFLGILPKSLEKASFSSLLLLQKSYPLLRSLFFKEEGDVFSFVPCLPPEFPAGRMTHVRTSDGDVIHFEWSKKLLRRVIWIPGRTRKVFLHTPSAIDSFRIRASLKDRGQIFQKGSSIALEEKKILYFDHFQK